MQIFWRIFTGLSLVIIGISAPALADHVVLQSDVDSYATGQLLEDPLSLVLDDGQRIVLLSDRGDVIHVEGPFNGVPDGIESDEFDLKKALTSLIDQPDQLHASLGSTRFVGSRISTSQYRPAWKLDPFETGSQCVMAGSQILFWRSDSQDELQLVIQRPGSAGTGEISWSAGESESEWPDSIPVVNGELYVIRRPGWMDNAMIRLAVLPATVVDNVESSVAWLAVNGCKTQAQILLKSLP